LFIALPIGVISKDWDAEILVIPARLLTFKNQSLEVRLMFISARL